MFQNERRFQSSWFNRRFLDVVEFRKRLREICISLGLNAALVGLFTISAVDLIHDLHSSDHLAEWRKSLAVQKGIVFEIDKNLSSATVRRRAFGECDEAAGVTLLDGVI